MRLRIGLVALGALLSPPGARAGIPFGPLPDWISSDVAGVGTGGALIDLDRDGWLDLVVANGNDIAEQPISVYYNRGDGSLPPQPDWSSQATAYHGHLAAGDIDQDGWPDVAVAIYLGPGGFGDPGRVAVYLNDGSGGLPPAPSWVSADRFYCFSVALGDADGDGDLDLGAATGEPYNGQSDVERVYLNRGGVLDSTPGWTSGEVEQNLGCAWSDIDGDGTLDLAVSGSAAPHRVYFRRGATLESRSGWQSAASSALAIRLAAGDVDLDGYPDLAVSENDQLGGEGRFRLFRGWAGGLESSPSWSSEFTGFGSEVVIGDASGDGFGDLLGGCWGQGGNLGGAARAYRNRYSRVPDQAASWTSGSASVTERLVLGDVNNDGLVRGTQRFAGDGARQLFTLPRTPVRELTRVQADGIDLGPGDFCHDLEAGWLSLARAPVTELVVEYTASTRNDLVVINWDADQGNYLFYAAAPPVLLATRGSTGTELRLVWTGGAPAFDILESQRPDFGGGVVPRAEDLPGSAWEDLPGTLQSGGLKLYRVH